MTQLFIPIVSLIAGALIGLGFGLVQNAAYLRYLRQQQIGKFNNGWAVMPGSMRRVAYLLIALALVQFFCPLLFAGNCQWWVSGGVVCGYGAMLYRQLRERMAHR